MTILKQKITKEIKKYYKWYTIRYEIYNIRKSKNK